MLACLFMTKFESKLEERRRYTIKAHGGSLNACVERAFDRFMVFRYVYHYHLDYEAGKQLTDHLPSDVIDSLAFLLRTISACGPYISLKEVTEIRFGNSPCPLRDELFWKIWEPWFCDDDIPVASLPATLKLECIAAKAGAAAFLIGRYVRFQEPFFSDARRMAHKALAYNYDFDEFAPIFDGRSLRHLADTYFDDTSTALANSDLVWHDSRRS
jgi:hypothetical protein